VCYWVATEVIIASNSEGHPSPKFRAQTISRFIHTMNELVSLHNFNSVMQIYAGLNLPVVGRMKNTWSHVPKADRDIMNKVGELMGYTNNYKNYRKMLDSITETPCLPFISLLLRDLTFVEEDVSFVEGLINFQKMTSLSTIFAQLQDYRSQFYIFDEDPEVQTYFNSKIIKSQDELEQIVEEIIDEEGNENPSQDSDMLGDDAELESVSVTESMRDLLLQPDVYSQFHHWLGKVNVEDLHCLECWQAMFEYFKKADFSYSEHPALTRRETAEEIYYLYLQSGSPKYIGAVNAEILEELDQKLNSKNPIQNDLFDEIIEGCYARLEDSWQEFSEIADF